MQYQQEHIQIPEIAHKILTGVANHDCTKCNIYNKTKTRTYILRRVTEPASCNIEATQSGLKILNQRI